MRDNSLYVRITDREKTKIIDIADNKDMSISEIVREALRTYVQEYKKNEE